MKQILLSLSALLFMGAISIMPACSQKYKTAADTVKLNEKYVEVSNDIAELTSKLTIAQNNLPGFNTKATSATTNAQNTAAESSSSAAKATSGDLGDAKRAEAKADKALDGAKDAKSANNDVKEQEKKIGKLTARLQKKQAELQELEIMRTAIRNTPQ